MEEIRKKIIQIVGLVAFIIGFGTVGYMVLERWNFWDSLYMTTITLTTVGYGDISPQTSLGQVLASMIMILEFS